jgi:hypothetical protein
VIEREDWDRRYRGTELLWTAEPIVAELDGLTVHRAGRVRRPVDTAAGSGEAVDTLVLATRD